jgi:hypothetical protein
MIQSIVPDRGKKAARNVTVNSLFKAQVTLQVASLQLNLQQHCREGSHGQA